MKAIRLQSYGDIDQFKIEDVVVPSPGPGEVLVKIEASAVNHVDLFLRQGFLAQMIPLELPAILGGEGAGTIAALGPDVQGYSVGDRVIAHLGLSGRGSHAEYAVANVAGVARLPDNLSFEQGAAVPFAALTGRQAVEAAGVKAGDRVLIAGALGGVGRVAVHYTKELGATAVAGVLPQRIADATAIADEAIDLTIPATAPSFDRAISAAAPAAGLVPAHVRSGGAVGGAVQTPDDANPGNRVTITTVFHQQDPVVLQAVVDAVGRGELKLPIAQTFPLEQLGEAHTALQAGTHGKIVLKH